MNGALKLIVITSCLFFAVGKAQAITVIEQQGSFGSRMGKAMGEGFSDGFQRGMNNAQRAQEERWREEAPLRDAERRRLLAINLINNYDPVYHDICISEILESDLSKETKSHIISHVNKIYDKWDKNN